MFHMKKARKNEFDLMRAVSMLVIVFFHYSYAFIQYGVGGDPVYFMLHANGTWGALFVSLFFMLSGSSLYYNWEDRLSGFSGKNGVLSFYLKRFMSIFPMFYVGWFICYLMNVYSFNFLYNWGGPYIKLLYTLFGMDGYFLYRGLNYYTIGEWFLGAIIMLYILYPLLQWGMKKHPVLFSTLILLLFSLNTGRRLIPFMAPYNSWVQISDNINIITCLMSFWIGMLLMRYNKSLMTGKASYLSFSLSLILSILILFVPLPAGTLILTPILSASIYILLTFLSSFLDGHLKKRKAYDLVTGFFSRYSYPIFLIHHVVIQKMITLFTGKEVTFAFSILYFFVTLLVISLAALLLSKLTDLILKGIRFTVSSLSFSRKRG